MRDLTRRVGDGLLTSRDGVGTALAWPLALAPQLEPGDYLAL